MTHNVRFRPFSWQNHVMGMFKDIIPPILASHKAAKLFFIIGLMAFNGQEVRRVVEK